MADVGKVLGQVAPGATTETTLYTVPALTESAGTSLVVCNRSATAATFRISVSVGGGGTATKDYLFYDYQIDGNGTFRLPNLRWTLATTDIVRVYASTANLSFTLFGLEHT